MIPTKVYEAELARPRTQELFIRVMSEPHVKNLAISRKTAVNLHLQGISVEHAHSILDHLQKMRLKEAKRHGGTVP